MIFRTVKDSTQKPLPLRISWPQVDAYLSRVKDGTPMVVEIKRKMRTVSDPMRKYYYAAVLPGLCQACGYEPEEADMVHYFLKAKYFQCEQDERGMYRNIPSVWSNKSDKAIPIKQEFTEWVKRKAAENGVYIADPGE